MNIENIRLDDAAEQMISEKITAAAPFRPDSTPGKIAVILRSNGMDIDDPALAEYRRVQVIQVKRAMEAV